MTVAEKNPRSEDRRVRDDVERSKRKKEQIEKKENWDRVEGFLPPTPEELTNREYYIYLTDYKGKRVEAFKLFTFSADVSCYTTKKWARYVGLKFYRLRIFDSPEAQARNETPILDSLYTMG